MGTADALILMALGTSRAHRVLKGARPGELPVERPAKVYLTINGKLAQRMGLALNPILLSQGAQGRTGLSNGNAARPPARYCGCSVRFAARSQISIDR